MMLTDSAERDRARLNYEALSADAAKRVDYQVSYAEQALKSLMLVNGGAIIGLFTFIGNSGDLQVDAQKLWWAFIIFVAGLLTTLLATIAAYYSQAFFYESSLKEAWNLQDEIAFGELGTRDYTGPLKHGVRVQKAAVALVFTALAAFAVGSAFALSGVLPA